jgi:hypothetical protein
MQYCNIINCTVIIESLLISILMSILQSNYVEELDTHVRTDGSILCTCVVACTLTKLNILIFFSFSPLITFCSFLTFSSPSSPSLYFYLSSLPWFLTPILLFLLLFPSFLSNLWILWYQLSFHYHIFSYHSFADIINLSYITFQPSPYFPLLSSYNHPIFLFSHIIFSPLYSALSFHLSYHFLTILFPS